MSNDKHEQLADQTEPVFRAAPLLLYDGECGLCDGLVQRLLRMVERRGVALNFAPLQGETARAVLRRAGLVQTDDGAAEFDSLVFVTAGGAEVFLRTDGVIGVLKTFGGGWGVVARVLRVVPRGLRDFGYRCVARVRRGIFGRVKSGEGVAEAEWARRTRRVLP